MKISHHIDIEQTPAGVFVWLADPEKAMAWMSSVSSTEILERTPDLVGTRFRETVADDSGSTELRGVVTACRPDQLIAFHLEGEHNDVDVEYRLEPIAGGTRMTMRADVRLKGALWLVSLGFWPLFKRRVLRGFRNECAALKRLAEAAGGGAARR